MTTPTGSERLIALGLYAGAPTNPTLTSIEHRGHTLQESSDTVNDSSYNGRRTAGRTRRGSSTAAGDITFAWKPTILRPLYTNFFRNDMVANKLTHGKAKKPLYMRDVLTDADVPYGQGFLDMYGNTLELSIQDGENSTVKFGYVGREWVLYDDGLPAATVTPAASVEPFIHVDCVFKIDGEAIGYMTGFNLSLSNNLTANKALGARYSRSVTAGNFTGNGSFSVYAESAALFKRYVDEDNGPIVVEASNGVNKEIWTVCNPFITGISQPFDNAGAVTQNVTFVCDPDASNNVVTYEEVTL